MASPRGDEVLDRTTGQVFLIVPMNTLSPAERRVVYARLVRGYADTAASGRELDLQWTWLMAAHVVGQHHAGLHFDSHCRMLALARQTRDWKEVLGQLARLALLPLGHLLRRIPHGNIGRSTVPITRPMQPPETVQVLIDWATLATRLPK
jgi:hypothetical protein